MGTTVAMDRIIKLFATVAKRPAATQQAQGTKPQGAYCASTLLDGQPLIKVANATMNVAAQLKAQITAQISRFAVVTLLTLISFVAAPVYAQVCAVPGGSGPNAAVAGIINTYWLKVKEFLAKETHTATNVLSCLSAMCHYC